MKVLLDECVTRYLKNDFTAAGQYDVLVTVDQNLQFQQNLNSLTIAIVVLKAKRSTYRVLKPLMPRVLDVLQKINPAEVIVVK